MVDRLCCMVDNVNRSNYVHVCAPPYGLNILPTLLYILIVLSLV